MSSSPPFSYQKGHVQTTHPSAVHNFIDNELRASQASSFTDVHDPATSNLVARVPQSTDEELRSAVESAQNAFLKWRRLSVIARQKIMFQFVTLIRQHGDRLAESITLEQGKTLADAKADVYRGLQVAETACGITTQIAGQVLEVARDMETRQYFEPLGVVAAICPFNFPAMIPLWSIPIAVVTGNSIIVKPSERDPGAVMILAQLAKEAGFPPGVINIIHGTKRTVDYLLDEPSIKAISFVGSNRVGEYIYARASANGKRVQANLGAKNHAVILPDANKDSTINSIVAAAFGAAGQRCMALSVVILVGVTKDWLPDLVIKARQLRVDGGFEPGADVGPVISAQSKAKIEQLIQSAQDEGASILLDGRDCKPAKYPTGFFVGPTVISGVTTKMRSYREEIFGPVLLTLSVDTLDEAIEIVNANEYGNGASLFTTSGPSASRFQTNIEAGQQGINVPIPVPLPMFSFTGNKKSIAGGGGRYFYGRAAIDFYTQQKTVTSLWRSEEASTDRIRTDMPTHL